MEVKSDVGSIKEDLISRGEGEITPSQVGIMPLCVLRASGQVLSKSEVGIQGGERGKGSWVV